MPIIVLGGYLGAGKTTIVNALLSNADGLRVTVLVNDFGAINVDASLIRERGDDVIGLENGCVCCTIGGRLVETLIAIGERQTRPDLLVIEASGVSDPMRIAQVGLLDKAFRLHGIVVAVDVDGIAQTLADPYVGDIARKQIASGSTLVLTKTDLADAQAMAEVTAQLDVLGSTKIRVIAENGVVPHAILFPDEGLTRIETSAGLLSPKPIRSATHALPPGLRSFVWRPSGTVDRARLKAALATYPQKLLRAKGFVPLSPDVMGEVHAVGSRVAFTRHPRRDASPDSVVVIGVFTDAEVKTLMSALDGACVN
ncbi:CobW family GTP-binding protein [Pandoraea aquatica]|uniref:CobW family GTP-binding protein n=1 Tax=Pandoraea aquatica TaxID=2508290 RepID=UPI001FE8BAAC|nr:GTP-binding protein [Pandoraea aquatica]